MKKKPKTNLQTKQLLPEVEELRARLEAAERRSQEVCEILQAQIAGRKQAEETFAKAQEYTESIVKTIREPLIVLTPYLKVIATNRSLSEKRLELSQTIVSLSRAIRLEKGCVSSNFQG